MNFNFQKFEHLLTANQILSSTLHLPELLRQIMKLATEVVEAETSSLLLYEEQSDTLVFNLALNDKESQLKEIRLKLGEGIAGCAAKTREIQIVNDVTGDPRWTRAADRKTQFQTRSVLAIPLLYRERLLGVIEAINKKQGTFSPEDAEIMRAFAAQAAVSIENARMFENLRLEKEKIEAIFSQMSDGALFVDAAGKKLLVNRSAEKLLGAEYVSRPDLFGILSDFDAAAQLKSILASDARSAAAEFVRSQGKTLYLQCLVNKIFEADGRVLGLIFIFRDITAEKRESLLKRNFLSLISHKLRTPLVTIAGYGPLLLEDDSLNEFQRKAVSSIARQGSYLTNLVDKLLYFTMIESEDLSLTMERCSLAGLSRNVLASLRPYLEEKQALVTLDDDLPALPPRMMDREKIEAVIRNLVENAIKFNTQERKTVHLKVCRKDSFLGLSVIDNGPGIPPEEREKIFQKFYQIEESFTGQVEGAGLGLALARRIVEAHGGSLTLESGIGKGATFSFLLPEDANAARERAS